jgi:hypothetical protein
MHLFASSVSQAAETFLHAGYISAQPPAMAMEYPMLQDTADTGYAVTLENALQLSETASQQAAIAAGPVWFETFSAALPAVAGVAAVAALAALALRHGPRWIPRPAAALGTAVLALGVMVACVGNPWEDVPPADFEDPDSANLVLMHSLVKEGVVVHHHDIGTVTSLATIESQIALPVDDPTEAQQYALDAYGRDGWGNDFAFSSLGDGVYEVSSAGPDGELETDDDVLLEIDSGDVANDLRTYYLVQQSDALWVFIRTPPESYSNQWDSGSEGQPAFDDTFFGIPLTVEFLEGNELSGDSGSGDWATAIAEIQAFYDSLATADDPVVVQIYDPSVIS